METKKKNLQYSSVCGLNWSYKKPENRHLDFVKNKLKVCKPIAEIITNRYHTKEDLNNLINSSLIESISDPYILKDLRKSIDLVYAFFIEKKKIGILGDYDVDGCSSAALIHNYFMAVGIATKVYIPDRIKDGYGLSENAIDYFHYNKIELLITLDCGTNDYEIINIANQKNIKTIVIDHHEVKKKAKPYSIINPKQCDKPSQFDNLSTVGLSFIFVFSLHQRLIETNYLKNKKKPDLRYFLDLVALGTVCDLVPLNGLNRVLVKKGLAVINKKSSVGLATLVEKLKINYKISEDDIGFFLGPCINAAGRIGNSYLGFKLLSKEKNNNINEIADKLLKYNLERKTLEQVAFSNALDDIERNNILSKNENLFILIENKYWHPGIVGIIANRLLEKYQVPCFIISSYENKSRGSVRTPHFVDTSHILENLLSKQIISSGGGHKMAGGFVVNQKNIEELRKALLVELRNIKFQKDNILLIDAVTDISKINSKLLKDLSLISPFGIQNKEPIFVIKNVRPLFNRIIGNKKNHISCVIEDIYGLKLKAVAFNAFENKIGESLLKKNNMHVAGKIKHNKWNDKVEVQFIISDIILI